MHAMNNNGQDTSRDAGGKALQGHPSPRLSVRRSSDRGHASHGWLESHHTFSFATYFDPDHMGFRSLRVINEDRVTPGQGFPSHPHRDMEIFSYVLEGTLRHQDSMGNSRDLKPGQLQLMGAGSGIVHSEANPSASKPIHFLQIWIKPSKTGLEPTYSEWHPGPGTAGDAKTLLISPDGREGSATIRQDAEVWRVRLANGTSTTHANRAGRGTWFHLISGAVQVNGTQLHAGDAVATDDPGTLHIHASEPSEALLFDLV